jgi:hypothetical protein
MRLSALASVGAVVLFFAASGVARAVTVTESGDAGSLPPNAQATTDAVDLITGQLGSSDDEDMYRICLTGGKTFSATTNGSDLGDPQLFLFDATGRGVYANDDNGEPPDFLQSTLPAGHPLTPDTGGTYYLAISSFRNRPVSQGGEIFEFAPPLFDPVLGPVGPGGGSPVTAWNNEGFTTGTYRITLTGTRACLPTNKDECKNGGWRTYGVFKNQGDCVSFVATGGRSTPALARP